jgi:hypothetical protein
MNKFDNSERRRYYGNVIGDFVKCRGLQGEIVFEGKVVGYGFMDNNRIFVEDKITGDVRDWVAEWTDNENRDKHDKKMREKYNQI